MPRRITAVLSTAAIAAVIGLPGCSSDENDASTATSAPSTSASLSSTAAPQAAPLPPPDALAGVLYRLADASVPGAQNILKMFPNVSQKVGDYIDMSLLDALKADGFIAAMEQKYKR